MLASLERVRSRASATAMNRGDNGLPKKSSPVSMEAGFMWSPGQMQGDGGSCRIPHSAWQLEFAWPCA